MRKKWLIAGTGFGVGAAMLLVTGFSAMANTSGYDVYKTAMKNTKAVTSLAANADLAVTDNGKKVFGANANIKLNHEQNAGSMDATFGDNNSTHSLQVNRQDGKVIFKNGESDVYRVMEHDAPKHDGPAPNPPKAVEQTIDALMGNLRELATVENGSDGSIQDTLHISGSQIPAAVNVLGSLAISKIADSSQWDHSNWNHDANSSFAPSAWKVNFPKLTNNIKIEQINLDATITADHLIERQAAEIKITGQDDSGNNHVVAIQLHVNFSGFNQTEPDRIDLTGKQIQTVPVDGTKHSWKGNGWHH